MKNKAVTIFLEILLIGMLVVLCNTGRVMAVETVYIRPDGSVDPPTAPIQHVGDSYTLTDNIYESVVVQRDNIIIDGSYYALQGSGTGTGFDISNINNVTIKRTRIMQFDYGIHVYKSNNNTIIDNILTSNAWRGIFISNSSSNIISRNKIVDNARDGIFLWLTNTTTVSNNNVSNNGEDGISLAYLSFYNTIAENTVAYNAWAGISLGYEVSNGNVDIGNIITGNNITNSAQSWAGIYIDHSSGNTFCHNNLNTVSPAKQVVTVGATNIWDNGYPYGGNYWTDYTGMDSDGDGIGDIPYTLDAGNADNYPFMNRWTPQAYDIAVANIVVSKNIVGQGFNMSISVGTLNQGSYPQTFKITVYSNTTAIKTETTALGSGEPGTITFTWDTTGFTKGDWTISAHVDPIAGEIDLADNTRAGGTVKVATPGDVNADGIVGILDAAGISAHWYPGPPIGPLGFDANFDINNDGVVGILDAALVSAYWTGPPKGPLAP